DRPPIKIEKCPEGDHYQLSHSQKRLWFFNQMAAGSPAYNIFQAIRFTGELDIEALKQATHMLARRHEALRTSITMVEDENGSRLEDAGESPAQVIHEQVDFAPRIMDISQLPPAEKQAELKRIIRQVEMESFDLSRAPLSRLAAIGTGPREHTVVFVMHHIVSDGWSMRVMIREFSDFYGKLKNASLIDSPPPAFQYRDFAYWQNNLIAGDHFKNQRQYWHKKLDGDLPGLNLPTDYPRLNMQSFKGAKKAFDIDPQLTEALKTLSRQEESTLFMILTAALKIVLYRYTNQEDILIGTLTAGRSIREVEHIIGYFVNILVLRDTVNPQWSFKDFLAHVRRTMLEAYDNQEYPFDKLVDELRVERNTGRSPVFDIMAVFH
ncbi:MAG: non-ribosomal peptide synthetase, partial [bacterium]|nr:non-ribosomal peptide synthetase [bacterium]